LVLDYRSAINYIYSSFNEGEATSNKLQAASLEAWKREKNQLVPFSYEREPRARAPEA
jgi:hypothetical protein